MNCSVCCECWAGFSKARASGKGLSGEQLRELEPSLTDSMVQELLGKMALIHVLQRTESGHWLLARDLQDVKLAELYEAAQLRAVVRSGGCAHRRCPGNAVAMTLANLRTSLQDVLQQSVSSVYEGVWEG